MTASGIFDNEASSVDLKVYDELRALGWTRESKTLLYQPKYDLSVEEQVDFPGSKNIRPDFVLQDLQGIPLAVIENKLDDPNKALPKLRLKYSRVLRPRFLYACSAEKILFYDTAWKGVDAGEFKPVNSFLSLEEMKQKIQQELRRNQDEKIVIDTTIAGGYDSAAGKERYYQLDCINTLIEGYQSGKQKMLVHMATGLGKTRVVVALTKALLAHGQAKRVLFVVDRRFLARQAIQKGFSLISPAYNATWITSANYHANKGKDIHVVVIDTLELLHKRIPSNYYDLLIVDECHRSITFDRKLIFDHFLCPRIGLTATPRIAKAKEGKEIPDEDLAILDTYRLFGCETRNPDYEFGIDRGIAEGFLAPYSKAEIITNLTKQAMEAGVEYDHLLDPDTREKIVLDDAKKIELEKLNKRILSEEQARRWAEEIRTNTAYGEKVIVFAASQAHALMLTTELNTVFNSRDGVSPRYAEPVISENDDLNYTIKEWFEKPYQNPRIVVSVDIMSTGVDIPCVRYIAFCALTKSVGKYIQIIGRGTRLDPKTGKFSFKVLDFVGLCARMQDNGNGSPKENEKIVDGTEGGSGGSGGGQGRIDGILDNPDPKHLIQRVFINDGVVKIIDNIPIPEARKLFEEGVKTTQDPRLALLRRKAWENKEYEPSDEELEFIREWVSRPEIYLDEQQLQRIYDFPAGSIWDFFLDVLEIRKIPTTTERIEMGFEAYLVLYNFTPQQVAVLRKIKDVLVANISSRGVIDLDAIFANPIYSRLIGRFDEVNQQFDGRLKEVIEDMRGSFKLAV